MEMDIGTYLKERARENPKVIALPESWDERVLAAASGLLREKLAGVLLIGDADEIRRNARRSEINLEGAEFENPRDSDKRESFTEELYDLRKHKGLTRAEAARLLDNPMYWAALATRRGECAGYVAGADTLTADVLRPALQVIRCAPGVTSVSSFSIISLPKAAFGADGVLFYADTGVVPEPTAAQLAEIAVLTAENFQLIMRQQPRVAMLSYSSKGSAKGRLVDKVKEATALAQKAAPQFAIDGELQFDAAVIPWIALKKVGDSPVAGRANVLIFPDLAAANIGYKMSERFADAVALGPIVQGMNAPINDVSRGCKAEDIVLLACVVSIRAGGRP